MKQISCSGIYFNMCLQITNAITFFKQPADMRKDNLSECEEHFANLGKIMEMNSNKES